MTVPQRDPAREYRLSVKDAAAYLGLSTWTVYEMAERGELAHLRIRGRVVTRTVHGRAFERRTGGRIRFCQSDLDAWIDANRQPARATRSRATSGDEVRTLPMPAVRRFS